MEGNEDEVRTLLEVSESQINLLDKGGDEAELLQKGNIDNQALNKKERISSSVSKSNFDEKSQTQNLPTTYTKTGENVPQHLQQSTFESASEIEKRNLSSETNLKPVTGENKFDTPSSCLEGNQNSAKCQKLNYSLVTQEQGWNDSLISQNGIRNTENASTEKLQETVGPRNDMVKTSGVEDKSNPEYLDEENPQEKLEMFGNNKGAEKSSTVHNIESKRAGKLGNSAINVSAFSGIENANNRSSTETNVLKSTVEPIVKMKCNNQDQAILADNGKDQRDTNTSRSQLHVEQLGEGDNQVSENEENNESSDPDESSGNEEKGESKMENNATNVGKGDSSAKKKYHHEHSNQSKKKKKKRKRKGRKRRNERKSSNVDNLVKSDEAEKVFGKNQITSTSSSAANAHHNLTFANPLLPLPGVIQEEQDNGNTKKNHYTPPTTRSKCQNLGYQHQFPFNEESGGMELLNLEPFEPEKSIEVTFFVAAPREMEDNRIAIFFGSPKLGEWKKIGVMMDPFKHVKHSLTLLINSPRCLHTSACQIFSFWRA